MVMIGCFLAACLTSWIIFNARPEVAGDGRQFVVLPAILSALATGIAAAIWTRSVCATAEESFGSLLIMELIAFAIVGVFAGYRFHTIVFSFWIAVSLIFAPWWLLGSWRGRARGARGTT